jgi:hypothetical protein
MLFIDNLFAYFCTYVFAMCLLKILLTSSLVFSQPGTD